MLADYQKLAELYETRQAGGAARVSVVIPTHNYGRFLGEAIQSVLSQSFTDFEAIVVDDGSTDNTREVFDSFGDPRLRYIYQENRGVSAAQNTGIKAANGKYIAILGADDMWLPAKLERQVKLLDSYPEVALVCSDAYVFDSCTGADLGRRWHHKPFHYWVDPQRAARQPLKELLSRGCFIAPQTALIRRFIFNEVGYFDESLYTHEDWDLFIRIARRFQVATMDIPLTKIRLHSVSLSANWDRMYQGATVVLNKAKNSGLFSGANLKLIEKRLAQTHFSYGKSLIANNQIIPGREKLLMAIRIYPWIVKPYFYLVISFLGNGVILNLKPMKRHFKWLA
jgi:glycosyltransferase involved in cell wall biosynthesis